MRKIYQKSTKIRMLAVRSQENSFEFFELEEDDIRRLNLNGNFHIIMTFIDSIVFWKLIPIPVNA